MSERKRNPDTGQFISSPAGAGQSPAIKEEEVIVKEIINKEEINEDLTIEELRQNLMIDKELYID